MDRAALAAVEDVAVAAQAGVAGPFVSRHAHEAPGLVERGRQAVELLPERIGDLKIVALVSDDIDERLVAGVTEVAFSGVGANRFAALAMQVAPIAPQRRAGHDTQRIGAGELLVGLGIVQAQFDIAGLGNREVADDARPLLRVWSNVRRQALDRPRRREPERTVDPGGIAPQVLGHDGEAKRLARDDQRRQNGPPARRGAGNESEAGRKRKLGELVGCKGIDVDLELEALLAIGLQPQARRALAAVAETDGQGLALRARSRGRPGSEAYSPRAGR